MSIRNYFYQTLETTLLMGLLLILLTAVTVATIQYYFIPQLPPIDPLKDADLQVPLHVYTKDGAFIAEYGEQRRIPLVADENGISDLIKAVLAAEDDRFHEHSGVDLKSLFRALIYLLKTGEKRQGGSTITMQVARNFFLSHERTFTRKFWEILLALKIEDELSKEDILELYLNKIFFGHRAYGVGAAAQVYYGKDIDELTLAERAMLAGLPKAPSTNNPLTNPTRALERRNYVLERMFTLGYIEQKEYDSAVKTPLTAKLHKLTPEVDALYVAEMVRSFLLEKFGEEATYTKGYKVFTTIDSRLQKKANLALRKTLFDYDKRHGFKRKSGIIAHVSIPKNEPNLEQWAYQILQNYPIQGNLVPSLVLNTKGKSIKAINEKAGQFTISWSGISWARRYINDNRRGRYPKNARSLVKRGDIIMARPLIRQQIKGRKKTRTVYEDISLSEVNPQHSSFKNIYWHLSQVPEIEGALVALAPKDGTIVALAGGFDFYRSKFNRVTQALRQPGSTFKPFIYSAALSRGFSHSSIINDAPIAFRVKGEMWRPHNYKPNEYYGKTTLRKALAYSHNVSAVRLLDKVGVDYTINHLTKFGFQEESIPRNLTIALGTGEVTPLELASSFAVFANKGFRIKPFFIDRIEDIDGKVIFSANPLKICSRCPPEIFASEKEEQAEILIPHANCTQIPRYAPRVLRTHYALTITSMLQSAIEFGTGRRAHRELNRNDIAGKTGTTDNQRDAWFAGYSPDLVTIVWVGFDQPRSLGNRETGARTALPMWVDFMEAALKGKSKKPLLPRRYTYVAQNDDFHPKARPTKKRSVSKSSSSSESKYSSSKKSTVIPDQLF